MRDLWKFIQHRNWEAETKSAILFWIVGILFGFLGFVIWAVIRNWMFSTTDWMLCFIGYPAVVSWFFTFLYLCNNSFFDGTPNK